MSSPRLLPRSGLAAFAAALVLAVCPAAPADQAAAPLDVAYATPATRAGTKPMLPSVAYPTIRLWRYHNDGDLGAYSTAESVQAPESAILFYLPAHGKPGEILDYDVAAQGDDLKIYKGLSFWMKGDGSDGVLTIGTNWTQQIAAYPRVGDFSLREKNWHKVFVPFTQFSPDVSSSGFYFLNFSLKPATAGDTRVLIARPELSSAPTTEAIAPVVAHDPPGMIRADQFVTMPPGALKRVLAKLNAHVPVTIAVAGDSLTAGNQLWYRMAENLPHTAPDCIYTNVLAQKLAAHYGYTASRSLTYVWRDVDPKTSTTDGGNKQAGFEQFTESKAALAGALPFAGLQVMGVAAPGKGSNFGLDHLDSVLALKPDLIIWAYGANDAMSITPESFHDGLANVVTKINGAHIDLLLDTCTTWTGGQPDQPESYLFRTRDFAAVARAVAAEQALPVVDQYAAFSARGPRYLGDLLSDAVHPNEFGHRVLATTLAAALGVPDQVLFDRPLFAAGNP
jgi:lysophospholipase L1-like esterase